jgi:type II secretory pathway pseudopilin PulG
VVLLGLALSAVGTIWRTQAQREREQELLFVGREFRNAIASYYHAGAAGAQRFPQEIADLVEDKRFPEPKHHLRRLYADPMTGQANWNVIRVDMLGITGVSSSSTQEPVKRAGFTTEEKGFEDATCYCDWQFVYQPKMRGRLKQAVPSVGN